MYSLYFLKYCSLRSVSLKLPQQVRNNLHKLKFSFQYFLTLNMTTCSVEPKQPLPFSFCKKKHFLNIFFSTFEMSTYSILLGPPEMKFFCLKP